MGRATGRPTALARGVGLRPRRGSPAPRAVVFIPLVLITASENMSSPRPTERPALQEEPATRGRLVPASSLACRAQQTQHNNSISGLQVSGLVGFALNETVSHSLLGLSTSWALAISRSFWELLEPAILLQATGALCPNVGSPWSDSCPPEKATPRAEVPTELGGFVSLRRGGARGQERKPPSSFHLQDRQLREVWVWRGLGEQGGLGGSREVEKGTLVPWGS